MFIIYLIAKEDNTQNVLQSFCKSCSIDSIKFEKRLNSCLFYIKKTQQKIFLYLMKAFHFLKNKWIYLISFIKRGIRKKLFKHEKKEKISEHLSKMKK